MKPLAKQLVLTGAAGLLSLQVWAGSLPAELRAALPTAALAGHAKLTFWGFQVYQAPISDELATHWGDQMRALFPEVKAGERLTGVHQPGAGARFMFNGQPLGEIADPEFARLFFGIWLSSKTSEPKLRLALLQHATAATTQ